MTAILLRKKRGHKTRKFCDSTEDLIKHERLPPVSHIKEDLVLGVLSAGKSVAFCFFCFKRSKEIMM
jgi:hypothetical protein